MNKIFFRIARIAASLLVASAASASDAPASTAFSPVGRVEFSQGGRLTVGNDILAISAPDYARQIEKPCGEAAVADLCISASMAGSDGEWFFEDFRKADWSGRFRFRCRVPYTGLAPWKGRVSMNVKGMQSAPGAFRILDIAAAAKSSMPTRRPPSTTAWTSPDSTATSGTSQATSTRPTTTSPPSGRPRRASRCSGRPGRVPPTSPTVSGSGTSATRTTTGRMGWRSQRRLSWMFLFGRVYTEIADSPDETRWPMKREPGLGESAGHAAQQVRRQ